MNAVRNHSVFAVILLVVGVGLLSFSTLHAQESTDTSDLPGAPISEEAALAFVERFDAMFNEPNLDIADEIFAPEFVTHLPLAPELDLEAFKAYVTSFYGGISDMTQVTNQVIIGKDRLVIHVTYYGTHNGPLFGVPATGTPITMNGIGIFRFNEAGLAVENWAELDMVGVLAQIGAMPVSEPDADVIVPLPVAEVPTGIMSQEDADHFIERLTAFFNEPNLDIADEIFAPDTVNHLPLAPNLDLEAWKAYIASFYVGLSDIKQEVNRVIIAPDRLILDANYTGTHTGSLFGVPATGNPVSMNGITIFRFNEEGLVVEAWCVIDVVGLMAQIGAFPPPA